MKRITELLLVFSMIFTLSVTFVSALQVCSHEDGINFCKQL